MIIGHKKNLDFLEKAVNDGNLANVNGFFGPEEIGKKTIALSLAAKMLKIEPEKLHTHPDFLFLERGYDEKTGKTKKDISVDQIQRVGGFLKNRSWLGGKKVVVVDGAQFLNSSGANAFLKVLEEPGEESFVFLVADDEKKIPATILSRSQILFFSLVADEEMRDYLQNNSIKDGIDEILYWAWGRPGRMRRLLNEENFLAGLREEKSRWQRMLRQSFYERLKEIEVLFGPASGDHIESREKLIDILDIWTMLWREVFLSGAQGFDTNTVLKILENLRTARELLAKNVHPRLLVEKIILTF